MTTQTNETEEEKLKRYEANLQGEVDGAALYHSLAELEEQPELARLYRRLAETEERHGELWRSRLTEAGRDVSHLRPSLRVRILTGLARRFGVQLVLPTIISAEASDSHIYDAQP